MSTTTAHSNQSNSDMLANYFVNYIPDEKYFTASRINIQSPDNGISLCWLDHALHFHRLTNSPIIFIGSHQDGKKPYSGWDWKGYQFGQSEAELEFYWNSIDHSKVCGIAILHKEIACLDFDDIPPIAFPTIESAINEAITAGVLSQEWTEIYQRDSSGNYSIHVWYSPLEKDSISPKPTPLTAGGKLERRVGGERYTIAPPSHHKASNTHYSFITGELPTAKPPVVSSDQIQGLIEAIGGVKEKSQRPTGNTPPPVYPNTISPYHWCSDTAYQTILSELHRAMESRGEDSTGNRAIHCPNPSHQDKHPSAFIIHKEGHEHLGEIYCHECGLIPLKMACEAYGVDYRGILKSHPTRQRQGGSMRGDTQPCSDIPNVGKTPPELLKLPEVEINAPIRTINSRYVSEALDYADLHNYHLVTIQSPLGSGKTEALRRYISEYSIKTVVLVTPYNSLNLNFYKRFQVFGFQSHLHNKTNLNKADRVTVSLNSLHKLFKAGEVPSVDLLVLDEIETLSHFLFYGTLKPQDSVRVLNQLLLLINRAKHVWCMDANYGVGSETLLSYCGEGKRIHIQNTYQRTDLAPVTFVSSKANALHQLKEAVKSGYKVAVITDSINLVTSLEKQYKAIPTFVVHGENSDDPKIREALASINETVDGVQLFAASPTMQSGVDIQIPVDYVFAIYANADTLTSEDKLQQIGRFRHVEKGIVIFTPNDKGEAYHKPENPDVIKQNRLEAYTKNHNLMRDIVGENGELVLPSERANFFEPHQRYHYQLQCVIEAKRHTQTNRSKSYLLALLAREGYLIIFDETKATQAAKDTAKSVRETGEEIKAQRIADTAVATPITEEQYQQLRTAPNRPDNLLLQRENGQIRELFGFGFDESITPEKFEAIYPIWKSHRGAFYQYLWLLMDNRRLARLDADEMDGSNPGNSYATSKHRTAKTRLLKHLLAKANGQCHAHPLSPDSPITYTHASLKAFESAAKKFARELALYFGIEVDHFKTRVGLLARILEEIGLSLETVETIPYTDKDGNRRQYSVYRINSQQLALFGELALLRAIEDDSLGITEAYPTIQRGKIPAKNDKDNSEHLCSFSEKAMGRKAHE